MKKYAVVVAGGSGLRMGGALPKQFLPLRGKPVLWHTLKAFFDAYPELEVILVLPMAHLELGRSIAESFKPLVPIRIVVGGETRFDSVKNGLASVKAEDAIVFVHDAVRCLITRSLLYRCYEEALEKGNAVPAVEATDSMRLQTPQGTQVLVRDQVRIIQTPQTFQTALIKKAFAMGYESAFTDEATVVERLGIRINLVEGDLTNLKITRPEDLIYAERILESREQA